MNRDLHQNHPLSLFDDTRTFKKMEMALRKSKELDQSQLMDEAARSFDYEVCKNEMWNPEAFSLLYGTWLWENSSTEQRVKLNQLYWLAYYSQIISAEIATIFFNQTCAASLYGIEDFRVVCDTLDLESSQERAHINAFKAVSEKFEAQEFGERVFTYPMRDPFVKTMIYSDLSTYQQWFRKWQLRFYSLLSANSAFLGCQYFTVRGLRTLNGKIVQHQLSKYYMTHQDKVNSPIPSQISYHHFMDESFHFNTSTVIGHDVVNSLLPPTALEKKIANMTLWGCQKDHFNFSTAINGIFWYDPALYPKIYKVLRSKIFNFNHQEALEALRKSFCEESDGMHASSKTHRQAWESYKAYLADFNYVTKENKEMKLMSQNNIENHLKTNKKAFREFANNGH